MNVEEITNALGERADEMSSLEGVIAIDYWTESGGRIGVITIKVADEDQKVIRSFRVEVQEQWSQTRQTERPCAACGGLGAFPATGECCASLLRRRDGAGMMPAEPEIARIMADTGMERMQAINHARGRETLRRRLGSPMRSVARQDSTDDCPLFEAVNEPVLL